MVGLGQKVVVRVGGGGDCLKYLKRGWNRRGRETKILGKSDQGVGALKRGMGGLEPPYELCIIHIM